MIDTIDDREAREPIGPSVNPPDGITLLVGRRGYRRNPIFRDCAPKLEDPRLRARPYRFDRAYFEQGEPDLVLIDLIETPDRAERRRSEIDFKRGWAQGAGHRYAVVVEGDLSELKKLMEGRDDEAPGDADQTVGKDGDPEAVAPRRGKRGVQRPREDSAGE